MPRGRKPNTSNTTTNSIPKKSPKQQKEEEIQNEWLSFASDSFVGESLRNKKSSSNMRMLTKTQINNMLLNPQNAYESLQNLSQLFLTKSGIYNRLIEYFSYMLTFDTMLIPIMETSNIKSKQKMTKSFETTALYLEKLNPKTNLPVFAKELFTNGETFWIKIEDKKSIAYKQVPNKYCLVYKKEENVYRFVIDIAKFSNGEDVLSYPQEIQKACELYKSGNKDKFIEGQYYEVKDGVCFTFNYSGNGHAIPPFSNLFIDLINLDENKELQSNLSKLENIKMIHSKIPIDSKTSKPIVPPELAKKYNSAIKSHLDEGIFSIVNPFDAEVLNLNNNAQRTTTLVEEAVSSIFNSSGVSDLLFSNSKASSEGLKKSIIVDACVVIGTIVNLFTDYLSWECSNVIKSVNWKCLVMPFTHQDISDYRSKCFQELSYGGSKSYYLASCGFSPMQSINLLKMEDVLGMSDLFKPVESSHTQSPNQGGAPTNESKNKESSPITEKINETI